jgi:hypothetical protein
MSRRAFFSDLNKGILVNTASTKFAHISTDADCWGANTNGFDYLAEARRIRDAAEAAGVDVAFDEDRRAYHRDDEGNERVEIEWFDRWCSGGYEWSDEQWQDWFEKQIASE